jgi:hypothetical protein
LLHIVYAVKSWTCSYAELIAYYAMNTYGGVDVYIHVFLILALVGGDWSASGPGRLTPRGRKPPTLIGEEVEWAPEPV